MTEWSLNSLSTVSSEPAVLVSVMAVRGSAPREVGAWMWVSVHASTGTIGGGRLEHSASQHAREALAAGVVRRWSSRFALGPSLGQCCGGSVELLFEVISLTQPSAEPFFWRPLRKAVERREPFWLCRQVLPVECTAAFVWPLAPVSTQSELTVELIQGCQLPTLVTTASERWFIEPMGKGLPEVWVFGAGHVGMAVVAQLALLPCQVVCVDQRSELRPQQQGNSRFEFRLSDPLDELADIPAGASVMVMTHSHALDFAICRELLTANHPGYVGLIGSQTKRETFIRRLHARGIETRRLVCPIGAAQSSRTSRQPQYIALAVASELVLRWERDEQSQLSNNSKDVDLV